jgi:hypothetical protein
MADDVEIDRAALEQAKMLLDGSMGSYRAYAEDTWRRDTGVENPCGRTHLRVALENALGAALMRTRAETDAGLDLSSQVQSIIDSFEALDVSLGSGWDGDYVADLS